MRRILCPTDFSEAAVQATGYAGKFAKTTGSDLTLLNVQSLFSLTTLEAVRSKPVHRLTANDQLELQCREVSRVFKISCYAEVDSSINSLSTVIASKAVGFDLIILGTSGTQDYYSRFFGSHTYRVVREATAPVLLIPSGTGYQGVSTIVFAFDYQGENGLPITPLAKWAKLLGSDIRVLQVFKKDNPPELDLNSTSVQQAVRESHSDVSIQFDSVYSDDIENGINDYMLNHEADVLALCSVHHRFVEKIFHKSVIRKVAAMARYPIFIFHDE